jgi:hypothetical protein
MSTKDENEQISNILSTDENNDLVEKLAQN